MVKLEHLDSSVQQKTWHKYAAFACVVCHQTLAVFTMRYSQTAQTTKGPRYLSTSTVFAAEFLKAFSCFFIVILQEGGFIKAGRELISTLAGSPCETFKLAVPASLYTVQNNFLFVALANLSAAVYTGTYQIKTLTTAFFSVLVLGKRLTLSQWISLAILSVGVTLLQWKPAETTTDGSPIVGLSAIFGASLTSGFCGVYMEKLLKQTTASLWVKNVQLGLMGIPVSLLGALWCDFDRIMDGGLFQGYDTLVWSIVCINAVGGLAIAAVLRYADNIIKCFATAAAILASCALSAAMGELVFSSSFFLGAGLVVTASLLYGLGPSEVQRSHSLPGVLRSRSCSLLIALVCLVVFLAGGLSIAQYRITNFGSSSTEASEHT